MDTSEISTCERIIMKVIWDADEDLALQQIMDRSNLGSGKDWKPQTVSTFLARLTRKGFLSTYRKGRYTFYQPAVSKNEFWEATMREAADFFTKGDLCALVCGLCDGLLTDEQIRILRDKLNSMDV